MSSLDHLQFETLLTQLVEQGASTLHLSAGNPATLRVVNELRSVTEDVLTSNKIEELVLPLLTAEQKEVLNKERALIFGYTFENGLRFKINLFYQKNFLAADLHYISPKVKSVDELGLVEQIKQAADLDNGLIVVSGPFHSGKSTTAAAIIEHINSVKQKKIITLEEPIEFILTSKKSIVQQREVGRDTPSFVDGLDDCVETSVDVVLISQVDGKKEMNKVLELTEQGRLVVMIISANSVLEVFYKMFSFFGDDDKRRISDVLSRELRIVICQKLLVDKDNHYVVVPEILWNTDAVRLSIQDNKLNQINNIIRTSAEQGMVSFDLSIANLVREGKISYEEGVRHVEDRDSLARLAG